MVFFYVFLLYDLKEHIKLLYFIYSFVSLTVGRFLGINIIKYSPILFIIFMFLGIF